MPKSTRDSVDREGEFPFLAMIERASPVPVGLCSHRFHAPHDSIRSIRSRIWPAKAPTPTLVRQFGDSIHRAAI
ncbi:hypothetical protein [Sphingopyxis sp.]|uniref:hypothetical protein n=1 Tax=Sphingopyxis sp. TaxID=1908224 RepID=UPI002B46626B|nr:hypothetical protein [Sphingopyxis sp.]HJS11894.1 hypothetical protein [Sphingopyxis sp.]